MPNNASTEKRLRQAEARTLRNKSRKARLRTELKKFYQAVKELSLPRARTQLTLATKLLDKAAKTHLVHPNNAARKKSKMARAFHELEHRQDAQPA